MGPPDTHLYRMQLESRWADEDLRRAMPPDLEAPDAETPARRPLAGLSALFGRFAMRRALAPAL